MRSLNIIEASKIIYYAKSRNNIDKFIVVYYDNYCCMVFEKYTKSNGSQNTHRNLLPANISNKARNWFKNGKYHNIHGPASTNADGEDCYYYINGTNYTQTEWEVERRRYLTT